MALLLSNGAAYLYSVGSLYCVRKEEEEGIIQVRMMSKEDPRKKTVIRKHMT